MPESPIQSFKAGSIVSKGYLGNTAQFTAYALLAYYSVRLPKNPCPYDKYARGLFVHSDEKSDYTIRTPELCGIAFIKHKGGEA